MLRDTVEQLASVDPGLTRGPSPVPIGEIALAKRGRVLRAALVDWDNDFGFGIDVRILITEAAHERRRAAQARAAMRGRALKGQLTSGYTGPTRQGVLLQPSDTDQLSELLAEAVVRAEAIQPR